MEFKGLVLCIYDWGDSSLLVRSKGAVRRSKEIRVNEMFFNKFSKKTIIFVEAPTL